MKDSGRIIGRMNFFQGQACVFEIAPIHITEFSVWFQNDDVLRNSVYDLSKFRFALPEIFLGPLAVGDVAGDPDHCNHIPGFVLFGHMPDVEVANALSRRPLGFGRVGNALFERLFEQAFQHKILRLQSWRAAFAQCLADKLFGGSATDFGHRGIDKQVSSFPVEAGDTIGKVFKQGTLEPLALAQRFFGSLAFRDIPRQGQVVSPASVFEIICADLDRKDTAIPGSVAGFEVQRALLRKVAPMAGPTLRREVGVNIRYAHAEQFLTGITQNPASLVTNVMKSPRVVYQPGRVADIVQGETQEGNLLLRLFAGGPRTQGDDAERQVPREFLKQPNLFRCKSVGLCAMNGEAAECVVVFVLERQGDAGTKTALQKALPPRGEPRIRCEILNAAAFSAADGLSGGAAPTVRVGPGYAGSCEIVRLGPGPRDRAHAFGLVVFGIAHPCHAVTRLLADDPADFLEQGLLIGGAQEDLVA